MSFYFIYPLKYEKCSVTIAVGSGCEILSRFYLMMNVHVHVKYLDILSEDECYECYRVHY